MVILTVIGAVVLAVVGGIFLFRRVRHPKCPLCGRRVGFVIPLLPRRRADIYRCDKCNKVFYKGELRRRRQ